MPRGALDCCRTDRNGTGLRGVAALGRRLDGACPRGFRTCWSPTGAIHYAVRRCTGDTLRGERGPKSCDKSGQVQRLLAAAHRVGHQTTIESCQWSAAS